jgi:hypothetical protein
MNNRNQQTARVTAPAEATAPTYLNVFTVEEYENNGKTGKKWTKNWSRISPQGRARILDRTESLPPGWPAGSPTA